MRNLTGKIFGFLLVGLSIASSVLAQRGPRPDFDGRGPRKPPSPAQLAADELTMIGRFLKLDAAGISKLTGDSLLVTDLTNEQTTLQTEGEALRKARKALATDVATGNSADAITQENAIQTAETAALQARVTAAGQVLAELPKLGDTVSSTQATSLAGMLTGGGGPGFGFGPGR
jgi:hypothetical protein